MALSPEHAAYVIPCHDHGDRAQTLRTALQRQIDAHENIHFFLVDDGSQDDTLGQLRALCALAPGRLHLLHLPRAMGKAEAIRQGWHAAMAMHFPYIGYWDPSMLVALRHAQDFIDVLKRERDVVMVTGARDRLVSRDLFARPWQHLADRGISSVASWRLGLPLGDLPCGAKLCRNTLAFQSIVGTPWETDWGFDVELLVRLARHEKARGNASIAAMVYEYPLRAWGDDTAPPITPGRLVRRSLELLHLARLFSR